MNIGIQEQGSRGICAKYRETGCKSPTQNGTVRCMFFPIGADAPVTRVKPGKALRKERAKARTPSQDIRFLLFLAAFPPERMQVHKNVCTKVGKNFGAFLLQKPAGAYAPILYFVKNDKP